jgi:uncharacterized glyoxalase superfamily protein PhnB
VKIEHFALQVPEPVAMANWYVKHLGCSIARSGGEPSHTHFLLEKAGCVMLEIYRNPTVTAPNYTSMSPFLLHIAFSSDSLAADRDRLVAAGAKVAEDLNTAPTGDQFVMLRDPWGIALQLVKRAKPLLTAKV